jgi:hypothetical protein
VVSIISCMRFRFTSLPFNSTKAINVLPIQRCF